MLSAVFIDLAETGQLCWKWSEASSLSVFNLVALIGLLLLSAIALVVRWLYLIQQARVQLQRANEELKQKIDRQQQVEATLRASERRFSNLISNIPGYFYLVANDRDYTPEFISERVYEVTGYKQEEYLVERTITCGREVHPEDRDSVWELVQQAIEAREAYECTYRIITKSGKQKWVWERGRGIFDKRGELLSLGGFVTDINERKQTEEQLQKVRSQLELFFSQSLDGFFFMMLDEPVQWDDTIDKEKTLDYVFAHQRITKANQAILEQYGATEEQFLGLTPNDFYAHQLTYGREIWRRFFDRGKLQLETYECKLDGTPIWIEGDYICFYDAQGRITGHFGIQRDITERKQAQEALKQVNNELELRVQQRTAALARANQKLQEEIAERKQVESLLLESKQRLQDIIDNTSNVVIYVKDCQGRYLLVNHQYETIFHLTREQIIGQTDRAIFPSEIAAAVMNNDRQVLAGGIPFEFEETVPQDDGIHTYISIKFPLRDSKGKTYGICGISTDITKRKQVEKTLAANEARLRGFVNANVVGIFYSDIYGNIRQANDELLRIIGYTREELRAGKLRWLNLTAPEHLPLDELAISEAEARGACTPYQKEYIRKDGSRVPVLLGFSLVGESREELVAFIFDLSDRILAEKALRESEKKFRQIAENIREIFYLSDLRQSKMLYINPAYETIWGRTCQSLYEEPSSFLEAVHPQDLSLVIESLERQKEGESTRCEYRIIRPDGAVRWVWDRCFPILNEKGEVYRWCGVVEDITERREAQERLRHDSLHDTLTGLPNRTLLMDRLERAIERNQRYKEEQFAVLFLDLDRFKVINDSWGHLVGDQLLIALARRLQKYQRASDTIARLGGDEFVILLENISSIDDAIRMAERIQHELGLPFVLNSHEVFVSASIGITLSSEHYSKADSLLRDADSAMYVAKVRGKARHEVFTSSMHARALKQLTLENQLRRALNSHELIVYYQPIVSLATNLLQGFEALVRWEHPEQGMICPHDFIALAEETGLIISLDRLVLRQACHQLRHWQEQFHPDLPLSISVNLSGKQFARLDLIQQIDRILAETGLEGQKLKLEITESVLIENAQLTAKIFKQLQHRQIQVCLDDFGTGYSSLSYLQRFPINSIKIDRSFIARQQHNSSNDAIVRAIVSTADELGIEVIAEGIEKVEQLTFLQSLGCPYGQGYWFSPPRDSTSIEKWLKAIDLS